MRPTEPSEVREYRDWANRANCKFISRVCSDWLKFRDALKYYAHPDHAHENGDKAREALGVAPK